MRHKVCAHAESVKGYFIIAQPHNLKIVKTRKDAIGDASEFEITRRATEFITTRRDSMQSQWDEAELLPPVSERPLTTYYVPIKENHGFRHIVMRDHLTIERVSKDAKTERWEKNQTISLTRMAVNYIADHFEEWSVYWDAHLA